MVIVSFVLHVADIGSDIYAVILYHSLDLYSFYVASAVFVVVPFIYIVFFGKYETGGFEGESYLSSTLLSLYSYFLGPLTSWVLKGSTSSTNIKKLEAFHIFGCGYMEDIPQAIIALFFLFSRHNQASSAGKKQIDRITSYFQVATSFASGMYKLYSGTRASRL